MHRHLIAASAAAMLVGTPAALAQTYPERPAEIVVPYPPGGVTDVLGRVLAEGLSKELGGRFILVNRPGAAGQVGTASVARAKPDGYTLMFTAAVSMVVVPLLQKEAGYTLASFDPICQTFDNNMVVVTRPDSRFKSIADIVKEAKEKPGALNYGILGIGSIPHLAMVEFEQAAGIKLNAIPHKGDADVMRALQGGHLEFGAVVLSSAATSKLPMLGVFSSARNPSVPNVATVKEQGYAVAPDSIGGFAAPAGIPAEIKARLEAACEKVVLGPAYAKMAQTLHQPTQYHAGSNVFANKLKRDVEDKRRLLGQLGMLPK